MSRGATRKLARLILGAGMGDDVKMRTRVEGLIRLAIDERIKEILDAAESSTGLEQAIDAEVDRRVEELCNDHQLVARDDHHGHEHVVKMVRGF